MPESKASPRKVLAREREAKALELRKAGATFALIGQQLGVSEPAAHKAVMRAIKRLPPIEEAQDMRRLEGERLDRLLLAVWDRAKNGDDDAIDRVLKLMGRRAELLGLDAPQKQEITGPDGQPFKIYFDVNVDEV